MWNGSPVNSLMIGLPLLRMMPGISTLAVRRSKFASRLIGRDNVSQNSEQVDANTEKKSSCKFFGDNVRLCGGLLREPQLLPLLIEFDHF